MLLALEVFAICSPLFNQFVIDEVIVSGDKELLTVLVFGFVLLMITQTVISLARSWFLMCWSMDISLQWSARVFAHLTHLPVSFFEKRHLGDVVSRFGSMLTSLYVESVLEMP
ncbi:ABC transporter transmembrane domain-containing protein [Undibacterium sp. 14-3-2]|uniref:ABC transporter transmembrane domain-containing protein n=1 Tax=Undibacterium sp. 14-3-2 TaxID=2800129 RepID=UPI001EFF06B7|nr:ABC transporter transmembrane domain-containing protein [Undibacterium sp. 14-3-2]